ncbi:MAG: hypothetical protein PHV24_03620 [Candidatus Kapabacteria bacterium]|nr:hypothetical protein [Candidatus Kapabacteria bacterium]
MNKFFISIFIIFSLISSLPISLFSDQLIPAEKSDTTIVFTSPRSLTDAQTSSGDLLNSWGILLALSEHGFGFGSTFNFGINKHFSIVAGFQISGARNTDEFEQWDYYKQEYRVPDKVNRLFQVPFTVGLRYYFLTGKLGETFRPFVSAAGGGAWILATPYDREYFNAFHHSQSYFKPAAYFALGSDFGIGKSLLTIDLKYFTIPFGGDGLESIADHPLKNFGGFQIDLILGMRY